MRAAIAARETMAEGMGIHPLDLSSEAGSLRGVSALSDTEAERLEAALAARRRLSEVEVAHLWRANQQHLDARTVAAAPSAPMMRMYTEKDAEIRETMMRQANKEGGFVDWAYTTTDKGGDTKQKQQQHVRAWYWDEEQGCVETKLLSSLQTGGSANENMWAIAHAFDSGGFGRPLGHCSDSAGDVLSGLLALMLVSIPAYIALGCWLHILKGNHRTSSSMGIGESIWRLKRFMKKLWSSLAFPNHFGVCTSIGSMDFRNGCLKKMGNRSWPLLKSTVVCGLVGSHGTSCLCTATSASYCPIAAATAA